jgi:hypothetical protein
MATTILEPRVQLAGRELFSRMLSDFDYSSVVWTMTRYNQGLSHDAALDLVRAFLQWVSLTPVVESGEMYVMLKTPVEEAFHCFVLNTRAYEAFCDKFLGAFFHHDPLFEENSGTTQGAIEYTVSRLEKEFGEQLEPALKEWRILLNAGRAQAACVGCKGS